MFLQVFQKQNKQRTALVMASNSHMLSWHAAAAAQHRAAM
jgi:hypothetical protein